MKIVEKAEKNCHFQKVKVQNDLRAWLCEKGKEISFFVVYECDSD